MLWGSADGTIEVRASKGGGRVISGSFPYGSLAVLDAGTKRSRPRKERFAPKAFEFAVDDPERDIHLLFGHSFDRPLANKLGGGLKLRDTNEGLFFEARIADEVANTTHGKDALALLSAGLSTGLSPGFRVPDLDNAETIEEENPAEGRALIRTINQAVLYEISLVTRPAYPDASAQVEARNWQPTALVPNTERNQSARYRWRL
jgi:hypothetical protein